MTGDARLTRGPLVDVVTHVSGLVCLVLAWDARRAMSRRARPPGRAPRLTLLHRTPLDSAHPNVGKPGL
jgi:hypothetical protein